MAHTVARRPPFLSAGFENGEHGSNPIAGAPDTTTGTEGWGGIAGSEPGKRSEVTNAHRGVLTSQRPFNSGRIPWSPPQKR